MSTFSNATIKERWQMWRDGQLSDLELLTDAIEALNHEMLDPRVNSHVDMIFDTLVSIEQNMRSNNI